MKAYASGPVSRGLKKRRFSLCVPSAARGGVQHKETEQKRRDRINAGFDALREFIPVSDKKLDKAGFLHEAVTYVRDLQNLLRKCLEVGAVDNLPEEAKWAYRMLLPQRDSQAVSQSGFGRAHRACEEPVPAPTGFSADVSKDGVSLFEDYDSPDAVPLPVSSTEVNSSGVILEFFMQQQMQQQQALLQWLCACNPAMVAELFQEASLTQKMASVVAQAMQQSQQIFTATPLGLPIFPLQLSAFPIQPAMAVPPTAVPPVQPLSLCADKGCKERKVDGHGQPDAGVDEEVHCISRNRAIGGRPAKIRKCNTTAVLSKPTPVFASGFQHFAV